MDIPAELESRIDEAISHYPVSKRSAVLPVLHLLQHHEGYITVGLYENGQPGDKRIFTQREYQVAAGPQGGHEQGSGQPVGLTGPCMRGEQQNGNADEGDSRSTEADGPDDQ